MSLESNTTMAAPEPRSVWQHRDGDIYTVERLTNEHSTQPDRYPVTVVYRGQDGKVWSRRLADWHGSMTALSDVDVARLLLPQEPTLDGDRLGATTEAGPMLRLLLRAREDVEQSRRRLMRVIAIATVFVVAALAVAVCALVMVRAEAKKTQQAVAGLLAVEKTLSGLTDVQAQEVVKRKMLREIRTRAAAVAADPEAGKHVE